MKNISLVLFILSGVLMSGCRIYSTYERPGNLPVDSLYRDVSADSVASADTTSLGDMPWQQFFQDEHLRELISYGQSNNTDMLTALLRVDQAEAQLKAAKLAFLPSLTLSPQGSLSSVDGGKPAKTYELPIEASWEVDLFGSLRNAKKSSQATLLQQKAYQQAVRSKLIAMIAIDYYALLSIDSQIEISLSTLNVWREQVRTIEAMLKVGEENENALTQARAGLYELEASYNDLLRQQREAENALCTLIGTTSRRIERGTLDGQRMPDSLSAGLPLRLLSRRPDVVQAEMTLAAAYYSTNQARSAFYPSLTLSGSAGWTNSAGQIVSDPGSWILSALASLTQPIFNRGKLVSNLRVAKDEEQIALLSYKQALLDAGQEVNNYLYAAESAQRSLDSHSKQCAELERTVKTSDALYRTGNATYIELLSARQELLNARLSVVLDIYSRCEAIVNLYSALVGGCE